MGLLQAEKPEERSFKACHTQLWETVPIVEGEEKDEMDSETGVDRRQQRGKNGSWTETDKMAEMWGGF